MCGIYSYKRNMYVLYACVYIYKYIYINTILYIYVYICTYSCIYACTCPCACAILPKATLDRTTSEFLPCTPTWPSAPLEWREARADPPPASLLPGRRLHPLYLPKASCTESRGRMNPWMARVLKNRLKRHFCSPHTSPLGLHFQKHDKQRSSSYPTDAATKKGCIPHEGLHDLQSSIGIVHHNFP